MQIAPRALLFSLFILAAPALFFFIGIPAPTIAKDAAQYHAYAVNLVTGNGYSVDGSTFSAVREPGYPLFVAAVYRIFGIGNISALLIVQTVLLGSLGVLVYRLFAQRKEEWLGFLAGFAVSLLPSYGLYAHTVSTELLFTFLLGVLFFIGMQIALTKGDNPWQWYAAFGLVCGYATLVKVQLLFFLPFLALGFLIYTRPLVRKRIQQVALAGTLFAVVVGSWMFYVHRYTGTYSLTIGRPEVVLYMRAVRAQLSYAELTQYAHDWLRRSITGGIGTPFLMNNEFRQLGEEYNRLASTSAAVAQIKKENVATLLRNPGRYIYGNLIEAIKLSWIEHDYSDFLNRYLRAGVYLIVYALFLFGVIQLMYKRREPGIATLSTLAFLFIAYNYLVLTPFDTIPRYNTPYLAFYLIVGIAGIALWRQRRMSREVSGRPQ